MAGGIRNIFARFVPQIMNIWENSMWNNQFFFISDEHTAAHSLCCWYYDMRFGRKRLLSVLSTVTAWPHIQTFTLKVQMGKPTDGIERCNGNAVCVWVWIRRGRSVCTPIALITLLFFSLSPFFYLNHLNKHYNRTTAYRTNAISIIRTFCVSV